MMQLNNTAEVDLPSSFWDGNLRRRFLGWDRPVLATAVERLTALLGNLPGDHLLGTTEQTAASNRRSLLHWDLSGLTIALPSSLARTRFRELLSEKASKLNAQLSFPRLITIGSLPEQVYSPQNEFASDIVQNLAWVEALKACGDAEIRELVPQPPSKTNAAAWLELGKLLLKLHQELASEGVSTSEILAVLGREHPEVKRWQLYEKLHNQVEKQLGRLQQTDLQSARLDALAGNKIVATRKFIILACADLNRIQRRFVECISGSCELWIAAPESHADGFDNVGAIEAEFWASQHVDLPGEQLLVGNSPQDQAELAAATLAELGDEFHAREITLGIPEPELIPEIKRELGLSQTKARYGPGAPLAQSEPVQLLSLIARYVQTRTYNSFSSLIRHPAIQNLFDNLRIELPENWLSQIDAYHTAAVPKQIDEFINEEAPGSGTYRQVVQTIHVWLKRLFKRPQRVSIWGPALLDVLHVAYNKTELELKNDEHAKLYAASEKITAAILSLRNIPKALEPKMAVGDLVDWLIRGISEEYVPESHDDQAIEILGWLELALDDAPALILCGLHDGVVPESVNADPFLPNQLRKDLGMLDNSRRFARDLYAMQIILHSRTSLKVIVGRNNAKGDPLLPSRLLLTCPLENLPQRVLHLVQEELTDSLPNVQQTWNTQLSQSQLSIPRPQAVKPPRHITVTGFREYLKCPYRFYLKHVLKLRDEDDADVEMDARTFGVLIHDTLEALAEGPIAESTDTREVQDFLVSKLHELASKQFGPNPPAAVLIQIEQAELRLEVFAEKQAARAAEGWKIKFTEQGLDIDDQLLIGNEGQLALIGRIDRIDYHPETGAWAIWDYKTSDTAKRPVSVHWSRRDGWKDLQLPLYRHIAKKLGVTGNPTLGYIAIPKQASACRFHVAEFSEEQLSEADAIAFEVASKIAAGEFWPDEIRPVEFDDFERICQTRTERITAAQPSKLVQSGFEQEPLVSPDVVVSAQQLLDTPPRLPAVAYDPLLIRASAGTGKTFQLSNRLLQILLSGQDVDNILATTFTRKAAGEILARVLQRLATACESTEANDELGKHLDAVDTSPANCLATLRRLAYSIHRFRVGTLDSFFAQIARALSLDIGLPPGWSNMDPTQERRFQLQAIDELLDSQDRNVLVGLVRMLAKGDSKRQVTEQIRQTVSAGYATFRMTTAEAWDQLPHIEPPSESAIESSLLTLENTQLNHARAKEQVQKLHLSASIGDWEAVINHTLLEKIHDENPTYYRCELPDDLVAALNMLAERAAAEILPIRRRQTLASYEVLAAYDEHYSDLVKRLRKLAFADITYFLANWFNSNHSGEANRVSLEHRLDARVKHLLLDEFQDTAPDQWQILRPIAQSLGGIPRTDQSFFCVGDTKQAIYGWRGGVAEIFESVTSDVKDLKQTELTKSFRSSPEIMVAVNEVFQHLECHTNFGGCEAVAKQWSRQFPKHITHHNNPGYVCLQNGPNLGRDGLSTERKQTFLDFTAKQIADLASKTSNSIGVLFRTNADVASMIALLRQKGISASQDGGNPLTDSAAVDLILSLIHLADHPGDDVCRFHLESSPLAHQLPFDAAAQTEELALWFRLRVAREGLAIAIQHVADHLAQHINWWDQSRLEQLIRLAQEFQAEGSLRLREFEDLVSQQKIALPNESQVKVMTIHRSKGLEFDAVFLPELEMDLSSSNSSLILRGSDPCKPPDGVLSYMSASLQSMLPESWQRAFAKNKESKVTESLCLLYVAMTRARRALYMTAQPTSGVQQQLGSLLQSTLTNTSASTGKDKKEEFAVLYQHGDPNWYADAMEDETREEDVSTEQLQIKVRTDAATAPTRSLRVPVPVASDTTNQTVNLAEAFQVSHQREAINQRLMSTFYSQVDWLENYQHDRRALFEAALSTLDPEAVQQISIEAVIDDFEELLELASVRSVLKQSKYHNSATRNQVVLLSKQHAIDTSIDESPVSMEVDRLVVMLENDSPVAAEIIEFRSDSFDPEMTLLWLEDRIAHHKPRLQAAAQAVASQLGLQIDNIRVRLVMLETDDVVDVVLQQSSDKKIIKPPHQRNSTKTVVPSN